MEVGSCRIYILKGVPKEKEKKRRRYPLIVGKGTEIIYNVEGAGLEEGFEVYVLMLFVTIHRRYRVSTQCELYRFGLNNKKDIEEEEISYRKVTTLTVRRSEGFIL